MGDPLAAGQGGGYKAGKTYLCPGVSREGLFLSAILCTAASLASAAHYSIGFDDAALSSSLTGVDLGGAVFDSGAFVHIGPEGSRALLSSNDGSYTSPFRALHPARSDGRFRRSRGLGHG